MGQERISGQRGDGLRRGSWINEENGSGDDQLSMMKRGQGAKSGQEKIRGQGGEGVKEEKRSGEDQGFNDMWN